MLLTASASLRTAWLSSSTVALGFAVVASWVTQGGVLWPFLVVAPLIPASESPSPMATRPSRWRC